MADLCGQFGAGLVLTCIEMRDSEQPPEALSSPERLMLQVRPPPQLVVYSAVFQGDFGSNWLERRHPLGLCSPAPLQVGECAARARVPLVGENALLTLNPEP